MTCQLGLLCPIFLGWVHKSIAAGQVSGGGGGGITVPNTGVPGGTPSPGGPVETSLSVPIGAAPATQPMGLEGVTL